MRRREVSPGVTVDPAVCHGQPVIADTRILVDVLLAHLAAGDSVTTVAREYGLTRAQVLAAVEYARKLVRRRKVPAAS